MAEDSIKHLLSLSPTGHLQIISVTENEEQVKTAIVYDNKIITAFNISQAEGLFTLVAAKEILHWSKALIYWRAFIVHYIIDLCHLSAESFLSTSTINLPKPEILEQIINQIPPMPGAEYCNIEVLQNIWQDFDNWICSRIQEINVGEFLAKYLPTWRQVGKICFHLAENKQDPEYPFAFLVTYAKKLMNNSRIQYQPLMQALQEYAGEANQKALTNLLQPIYLAAQQCKWVQELVASKDIYYPLSWQPQDAYKLLKNVFLLEQTGIVVKFPDWWKKRPKAQVKILVGNVKEQSFNIKELLKININVVVGDDFLTEQELQELVTQDGLVQIKGQWVEINKDQLKTTLAHWQLIQAQIAGGMTFTEGMRLLAGAGSNLDLENIEDEEKNLVCIQANGKLKEIIAQLKDPESIKFYDPGKLLCAKLRPYQTIGVNWLCFLTELGLGACLADDMGLGKTIQIIALLLIRKQQQKNTIPNFLVVPASLLANWQDEINRFAPSLKFCCLHASAGTNNDFNKSNDRTVNQFDNFDLIITTYGMLLRQAWLQDQKWSLIILDEAQAIKNSTAKQTKAIKKLSGEARIILTGTPVENRLGDLWSLFDFICPGLLGSIAKFKNFIKILGKRDDLTFAPLRKLVQPYILRRLKTDKKIIADLPDKTEVIAWCNLTKEQVKLYLKSVNELKQALQQVGNQFQRRGLVLSYLTKFKQICNHPSQFLGNDEYMASKSGKFLRLKEICDEIYSRQEKVLIFTQYAEIIMPLAMFLKEIFKQPGLTLYGSTPVKQRKKIVEQFQQEDADPFLILSLKAGGTGLNLTAARHVIHFDRWWNPAVENQATDRAYRIGQKNNVLVHKFSCSGTIEEKIDNMIASKTKLANEILNNEQEILLTELNDQEIIDLVSLNIDSIQV